MWNYTISMTLDLGHYYCHLVQAADLYSSSNKIINVHLLPSDKINWYKSFILTIIAHYLSNLVS